jgi:hypothetical protein
MFGRDKRTKLIRQQLEQRGLLKAWWQTAEAAVAQCERGDPLEPMVTGAGPMPARSLVALLGLEPFVEGGVDWSVPDDLTEPGGAFYAPNNEVTMPQQRALDSAIGSPQ